MVIDARISAAPPAGSPLLLGAAGLILAAAAPLANAADGAFRPLSSAQITAALSGQYVTDDHHWGHHYLPDGCVLMHESRQDRLGHWSTKDGQLCLLKPQVSKTEPVCFYVQRNGVELRYLDGKTVVYDGFLRGAANPRLFTGSVKA